MMWHLAFGSKEPVTQVRTREDGFVSGMGGKGSSPSWGVTRLPGSPGSRCNKSIPSSSGSSPRREARPDVEEGRRVHRVRPGHWEKDRG